jgi:hypothetical protein
MTTTPTRTAPSAEQPPSARVPAEERRHLGGLGRVLGLAVVVLLLAELGIRLVEDRLPPPTEWYTPEYGIKEEQMAGLGARHDGASVVFIGSSVIDVSVDPSKVASPPEDGRPAYNAGLIGANLEMVDVWSEHVVEPSLRPSVVVIGVSSRDVNRNGAGLEGQTPGFYELPAVRRLLGTESAIQKVETRLDDVSLLFRYRTVLRRPLEALFGYDSPDRNLAMNTDLGQELHLADTAYQGGPNVETFFRTEPLLQWAGSETQFGAVRNTIDRLHAAGVRVIVLDVPVTDQYVGLHPRGAEDYRGYEAALNVLAAQTGAELVDTGTWLPAAFSDPLHLNGVGAELLTVVVDQYLRDGRVVLPAGAVPHEPLEGGVAVDSTVAGAGA